MPPGYKEIIENGYQITLETSDEGRWFNDAHYRTYLFDFPDDVPTLVDTCIEEHAETLVEQIEEIGIELERLIITHDHPDHVGAWDRVVEEYGVETWVPKDDDFTDDEPVENAPDNLYGHLEEIGRFTTVHIGGHTPGSSVLIDEDAGFAVCGDALSGADRRGLPAGYLIHPPQATNHLRAPEAVVDAERNLNRLLDFEFDVVFVYHGSCVMNDASDKLERYVEFEPNHNDPTKPSVHTPERKSGY